jgi:hypothetical protein
MLFEHGKHHKLMIRQYIAIIGRTQLIHILPLFHASLCTSTVCLEILGPATWQANIMLLWIYLKST